MHSVTSREVESQKPCTQSAQGSTKKRLQSLLQNRNLFCWCARHDSNVRPSESESPQGVFAAFSQRLQSVELTAFLFHSCAQSFVFFRGFGVPNSVPDFSQCTSIRNNIDPIVNIFVILSYTICNGPINSDNTRVFYPDKMADILILKCHFVI